MQLHRVTIDTAWRPDHRGQQRRQYLAQCLCGWSAGWFSTRPEAGGVGDEHRAVAAAAAQMVRAAGDRPDPAA